MFNSRKVTFRTFWRRFIDLLSSLSSPSSPSFLWRLCPFPCPQGKWNWSHRPSRTWQTRPYTGNHPGNHQYTWGRASRPCHFYTLFPNSWSFRNPSIPRSSHMTSSQAPGKRLRRECKRSWTCRSSGYSWPPATNSRHQYTCRNLCGTNILQQEPGTSHCGRHSIQYPSSCRTSGSHLPLATCKMNWYTWRSQCEKYNCSRPFSSLAQTASSAARCSQLRSPGRGPCRHSKQRSQDTWARSCLAPSICSDSAYMSRNPCAPCKRSLLVAS